MPDILELIPPAVQEIMAEYIQSIAPIRMKWGYPGYKRVSDIGSYAQFQRELEPFLKRWREKVALLREKVALLQEMINNATR